MLPSISVPWTPEWVLETPSHANTILAVVTVLFLFAFHWGFRCFYNLYLHPLANFPGPRAAAMSTNWVWKQQATGRAEEIYEKLHEQYSAHAIRISPNELHIDDVHLYKTVYSQTTQFLKEADFYDGFASPHTSFIEADPIRHKARRKLLNAFFSRKGIVDLQSLFVDRTKQLSEKLRRLAGQGQDCHIYNAMRCLTIDIITTMASGEPMNAINDSSDDFENSYLTAFDALSDITWDLIYQPFVRKMSRKLPQWVSVRISSLAQKMIPLVNHCHMSIEDFKARKVDKKVIYSVLRDLPTVEAVAESMNILIAGSDTTAFSLAVGIFHIIDNPNIRHRLVEALDKAFSSPDDITDLAALESIPYLNACVKETIRVAKASPGRLPRVVPDGNPLVVDGKVVPPGSIIGISAYTMHNSTELWGLDARDFNPNRWLQPEGKNLDQYMVSFSKGLRSCMGQNLAFAEVHFTLAILFKSFDLALSENSSKSIVSKDNFTTSLVEPGIRLDVRSRTYYI